MSKSMVPSLTGAKTDCLFGEVGYIVWVFIINKKIGKKVSWLTSPTGTSKRLVLAEIALGLVAFLGFDP